MEQQIHAAVAQRNGVADVISQYEDEQRHTAGRDSLEVLFH